LSPFSGNAVQPAGALGKDTCRVLALVLLAATPPVIVLIIPEISATQNPTLPMELRRSGPSGRIGANCPKLKTMGFPHEFLAQTLMLPMA